MPEQRGRRGLGGKLGLRAGGTLVGTEGGAGVVPTVQRLAEARRGNEGAPSSVISVFRKYQSFASIAAGVEVDFVLPEQGLWRLDATVKIFGTATKVAGDAIVITMGFYTAGNTVAARDVMVPSREAPDLTPVIAPVVAALDMYTYYGIPGVSFDTDPALTFSAGHLAAYGSTLDCGVVLDVWGTRRGSPSLTEA